MKRTHIFTIYLLSLVSLFALVGFNGNIFLPFISSQNVPGNSQEPIATSTLIATDTPLPAETAMPITPTTIATDISPTSTVSPTPTIDPNAICACSSDSLNCGDFGTQNEAQACFGYCMGVVGIDIHKLDQNNNMEACEAHFGGIATATPSSVNTATPIPTSTPAPTETPVSTLTPTTVAQEAVCDCSGNTLNCSDFGTQSEAQTCHDYCFEVTGTDIHRLDNDGDGTACTSLPNWLSR